MALRDNHRKYLTFDIMESRTGMMCQVHQLHDCDYKRQIASQPSAKRTEVYKNKAVFPRKDEPFFYSKLTISNANRNVHLHNNVEPHTCSFYSYFLTIFKMGKEFEVGGRGKLRF